MMIAIDTDEKFKWFLDALESDDFQVVSRSGKTFALFPFLPTRTPRLRASALESQGVNAKQTANMPSAKEVNCAEGAGEWDSP